MIHKIIFATSSNEDTLQQFQSKLLMSGVETNHLKSDGKLNYFESTWDDAGIPAKKNPGPQPRELKCKGETITCGIIYRLRHEKGLSDAEIGRLFGVSESTITRRRKKHTANDNFYNDSTIIF